MHGVCLPKETGVHGTLTVVTLACKSNLKQVCQKTLFPQMISLKDNGGFILAFAGYLDIQAFRHLDIEIFRYLNISIFLLLVSFTVQVFMSLSV